MSHTHGERDLPRPLLIGAGLLVLGAILLAAFSRTTDIGRTQLEDRGSVVAAYDVRLFARKDGSIDAYLADDGTSLGTIPVTEAGFVSGVLRGLARGRSLADVPADTPYRLIRYTSGRFVLEDTGTTERIDLDVFGPTNAGVLARLWRAGDAHRTARTDARAGASG